MSLCVSFSLNDFRVIVSLLLLFALVIATVMLLVLSLVLIFYCFFSLLLPLYGKVALCLF